VDGRYLSFPACPPSARHRRCRRMRKHFFSREGSSEAVPHSAVPLRNGGHERRRLTPLREVLRSFLASRFHFAGLNRHLCRKEFLIRCHMRNAHGNACNVSVNNAVGPTMPAALWNGRRRLRCSRRIQSRVGGAVGPAASIDTTIQCRESLLEASSCLQKLPPFLNLSV